MSQAGSDQDHAVNAVGEALECPQSQDAAEGKAHQVETFVPHFVGKLPDEFRHFAAGKTIAERFRPAVPGQFEEVDSEPLRHELRQRAPVLQLRNGGWHHNEWFTLARLEDMQAGERQVDVVGFAGSRL